MAAGILPRSLSLLPPELAHAATLGTLRMSRYLPSFATPPASRPVRLAGLEFATRVGLAANFDKNGIAVDGLARLGFGFLEIGTVTPKAQAGNMRPRVFRYPHLGALVNRLGFPNDGADVVAARLRRRRYRGVLGVNIGKNAATPIERAVDDYVECFEALQGVADYLAVNVSSPNTAELRSLQQPERLRVGLVYQGVPLINQISDALAADDRRRDASA
jgi:dihydroorotate dehydrogenase